MGRRNVSNVPGQAFTLMNDPLVIREASLWAKRIDGRTRAVDPRASEDCLSRRIRPPADSSGSACEPGVPGQGMTRPPTAESEPTIEAWADLCHVLINMKEFIFVD